MEDQNGPDIENYITSTLQTHPRWSTISRDRAQKLNADVARMAEGVFLWAYLITRMLTDALDNGDGDDELGSLLHSLPLELSELFDRTLGSLEANPDRFKKASQLLELVLGTWNLQLSAMDVFYALVDPEEIYKLPIQELKKEEREEKIEQVKWKVAARTKCLLEVVPGRDNPNWFERPRVKFIHRTVADYLKQPVVRQRLKDGSTCIKPIDGTQEGIGIFNPHERLALAQLARLKSCVLSNWCGNDGTWGLAGVEHTIRAYPADDSSLSARDQRDRFIKAITSTAVAFICSHTCGPDDQRLKHALMSLLGRHQLCGLLPCEHTVCWDKAFPLDVAARFGLGDYLKANLSRVPWKCRHQWGTHLFGIVNLQNRVVSSRSSREREKQLGHYVEFGDTRLNDRDKAVGGNNSAIGTGGIKCDEARKGFSGV
ncbi:hypothetical protein QBC44DRAFT_145264 [Cladorrhinum sp. PSN332]|nr:hypothetical protein QBC44DRAFT_145264 [Cladorrhinum sp. PSN332]